MGEEATGHQIEPSAPCFVSLNIFFIVSQGYCESRPTIYDQVQTQCCQFLKFLIKKELMFFTKGGSSSLPRGWGVPIYNWKNYNWKN